MNKYIKCEWIKIKKMHFVTYNMGIVLISILLSIQTSRGVDGIHPISTSSLIFTFSSALLYVQLLPALIVCLIIIYIYIEEADGGWNLILIAQNNMTWIVIIKLFIIIGMVLLAFTFYYVGIGIIFLGYGNFISFYEVIIQIVSSLICMLPLISIFYFSFLLINTIIVKAIVGVFIIIFDFLIMQTKYCVYMPQCYYYLVIQSTSKERVIYMLISLLVFFLISWIGIKTFKKKLNEGF